MLINTKQTRNAYPQTPAELIAILSVSRYTRDTAHSWISWYKLGKTVLPQRQKRCGRKSTFSNSRSSQSDNGPASTILQPRSSLEASIQNGGAFLQARVAIAQSVQRRTTDLTAKVRFQTETRDISLLHSIQTGSKSHPAPYLLDNAVLSLSGGWGEAVGEWCLLKSNARAKNRAAIPIFFYVSSWHSA
jgi:hypothetical protein